ncbi:hypothetical protein Tcan_02073 [Toxocara canis]|uniref:Uncharacterized protein n=1 Tax=Toxocara canis TaxID=6265 RepID=A0A0B2URF3_TOXCA|nr:hypothetical protein Tcan_02073 [Toxocara canis]
MAPLAARQHLIAKQIRLCRKALEQKRESGNERMKRARNELRYDHDLNELIYAKVDEILSPASRMNASFPSNPSLSIPSFNVSFLNMHIYSFHSHKRRSRV